MRKKLLLRGAVAVFASLLIVSLALAAMTNSASNILLNRGFIGSGNDALDPVYVFCNEVETKLEGTSAISNDLLLGDGQAIQYNDDTLSKVMVATAQLSNADIKALRATSKELVASPGADYAIWPLSAVLILDYGSEVLTESADNLQFSWNTGTTACGTAIEATGFIDNGADILTNWVMAADEINAASAIVNKNLTLDNTGDGEYGGNASNDTTMTVTVYYRIIKCGL